LKKLYRQLLPPLAATSLDNRLSVRGLHSFAEPVPLGSALFLGLICSFWHIFDSFNFLDCISKNTNGQFAALAPFLKIFYHFNRLSTDLSTQ